MMLFAWSSEPSRARALVHDALSRAPVAAGASPEFRAWGERGFSVSSSPWLWDERARSLVSGRYHGGELAESAGTGSVRGAFASARADDAGVHAIRGRMGGRPLFYRKLGDVWLLSSSLRLALRAAASAPPVTDAGLAALLYQRSVLPTPYEGVSRVRAGTALFLGPFGMRALPLPKLSREPLALTVDEAAEELHGRLRTALQRHVTSSHVTVAVSGGLDSTALLALLLRGEGRGSDREVRAVALDSQSYGRDGAYLRAACRQLDVEPMLVTPRACTPDFPACLVADGMPQSSPAVLWWPAFARAAAVGPAPQIVTGEFCDIILQGELGFLVEEALRGRVLSAARRALRLRGHYYLPTGWDRIRTLVLGPLARRAVAWLSPRRKPTHYVPAWLLAPVPSREGDVDQLAHHGELDRSLSLMDYRDGGETLLEDYGVEQVDPFLDDDLVEFTQRLHPETVLADSYRKGLFRRAMAGVLPRPVLLRSGKGGFDGALSEVYYACGGAIGLSPHHRVEHLAARGLVCRERFAARMTDLDKDPRNQSIWCEVWPALASEAVLRGGAA